MYKKVVGVVVSETAFDEASKIINIFTEEGIIGVIAKGAKRIKSPFFATTSKFSYGVYNILYKEKALSKLIDADILKDYRNIKKDMIKISYTTYITELTLKVYKSDSKKGIYDLYLMALDKINDGYDPLVISDILKLKLLDYLGIKPVIDKCVICGNTSNIITISSYLGGFVCSNCLGKEKIVSPKSVSLIRMLYYVDMAKIKKIDISKEVRKEIDEFINDYYDRYSGIYLKSKILIDDI